MEDKDFEDEIWMDIPNYEGYYQASNYGRVKRLSRVAYRNNGKSPNAKYYIDEKIKKIQKQTQGYSQVVLYKNGKFKTIRLNTLIAKMFVPNLDNKLYVNHIDGNKDNNRADNLEWCTASENVLHAYQTGLCHHYTKKIAQIDENQNVVCVYDSIKSAADQLKKSKGNICYACKHNTKSYGYYWRYL